jgi:uncharacterized protein (TIGR03083 family)
MTQHPFGTSDPKAYQARIRTAADAFLAAFAASKADALVRACPGWDIRDLVDHQGQIHQWATGIVRGHGPSDAPTSAADGEDLATWYEGTVRDLLDTLATTDPMTPCWSMQPGNEVARFWSRRQAFELTVHRVDAELAAGGQASVDAELAADGIAEILDVWIPRLVRRSEAVEVSAPILLACTDREERWLLRPSAPDEPPPAGGPALSDEDAASAAVRIQGPASGLLLLLWKRQNLSAAGVTVDGDAGVASAFLTSHVTP